MSTTVGTLVANSGIKAGSAGTLLTRMVKGTVSVTVSALGAGAEETISVTISGAAAGDIVMVCPTDAAAETGLGIIGAWASAADTVKIRVSNFHTSSLTGSTANWSYLLIKS